MHETAAAYLFCHAEKGSGTLWDVAMQQCIGRAERPVLEEWDPSTEMSSKWDLRQEEVD